MFEVGEEPDKKLKAGAYIVWRLWSRDGHALMSEEPSINKKKRFQRFSYNAASAAADTGPQEKGKSGKEGGQEGGKKVEIPADLAFYAAELGITANIEPSKPGILLI